MAPCTSRYVRGDALSLELASTFRSGEGGSGDESCLGRKGAGEKRAEFRDRPLSPAATTSTRRGRKVAARDDPLSVVATKLPAQERMGAALTCTGCLRARLSWRTAACLSLVVRDERVEGRADSTTDSSSSRTKLRVRLP
jgi:hypothetical protein